MTTWSKFTWPKSVLWNNSAKITTVDRRLHCSVLPPVEFICMIPEPLPDCSESFITIAAATFSCNVANKQTRTVANRHRKFIDVGCSAVQLKQYLKIYFISIQRNKFNLSTLHKIFCRTDLHYSAACGIGVLTVRLSVCLSDVGIDSKLMTVGSRNFHR